MRLCVFETCARVHIGGVICVSSGGTEFAAAASSNRVTLTYMGTAGWEIADGKTLVLVDPT